MKSVIEGYTANILWRVENSRFRLIEGYFLALETVCKRDAAQI